MSTRTRAKPKPPTFQDLWDQYWKEGKWLLTPDGLIRKVGDKVEWHLGYGSTDT